MALVQVACGHWDTGIASDCREEGVVASARHSWALERIEAAIACSHLRSAGSEAAGSRLSSSCAALVNRGTVPGRGCTSDTPASVNWTAENRMMIQSPPSACNPTPHGFFERHSSCLR